MSDTQPNEPPILEYRSVTKTFTGQTENLLILKDLTWSLPARVSASITGESGAGKSTLLHLAAALDRPTSGTIAVAGKPVSALKEKELSGFRAKTVGIIFQFHFLLKEFSVAENVWMPAWLAGEPKKSAQARARDLLAQVGMDNRSQDYPGVLSGGERQRVALARALINDPPLLLADEPTGNLDERNSHLVQELLLDLVTKTQKTLLLVTHDRVFAQSCQQSWRLTAGTLVPEEKP